MAYGKIKVDNLVYDNSGTDVEVAISGIPNAAAIAAKADVASPTFTGTVTIPSGASIADIGSTIQAFDADTAKTDVAQTFTAAQRGYINAFGNTSGTPTAMDFDVANSFSFTLTGNITISNPTNLSNGQTGSIFLQQDSTGSRTASWGSFWDFAGGVAPVLSTGANAVDRIDYVVRSSTSIHAVATLDYS